MNISTRMTSTAGALALALSLAACGQSADPVVSGTQESSEQSPQQDSGTVEAEHNDADVEFAQMMIVHHQGAIEMADLAVERAESDEVRTLAENIAAAQGPEIEQMTSWLEAWGEEASPMGGMDGMDGMDHGGMEMDGMTQEESMTNLESLSGAEFDRRFLELMTAHHQGAVEMAQTELADGQNPQALALAEKIIDDQEAEIAQMEQMLQDL